MVQGMIFVIFLASIHVVISQGDVCRPDEDYNECGPMCPRTCANQYDPPSRCVPGCRRGCFCKRGLLRNSNGICVLPRNCQDPSIPPLACGRNEVFTECEIPCNDCQIKNKCQFLVCNRGCMCRDGYFRNRDGICIPERECPRPVY